MIEFFANHPNKGKLLDLGCGQGRDAITLARMGFSVTGIDNSIIGIEQKNKVGQDEKLTLVGQIDDIYAFDRFDEFDIILLDSMFHFAKQDKEKEIELIKKIVSEICVGSIVVVCIRDTGDKVKILNHAIDFEKRLKRLIDKQIKYIFEERESGHKYETNYRMIIVEK